jgi:hypothetical protein
MGQLDKIGDNLTIFDRNLPQRALEASGTRPADAAATSPGRPPAALFEGDLPSEPATAAIIAHPRFEDASRMVAAGLVALYQGGRTINLTMPDRVRYIISVFAVHLHFAGRPNDPNSGLTASRLCKLCAERKICSEGRAESMLAIMREFGHLVPAPTEEDRRLRRLVPAQPLFDWHRQRCVHFFQAAAQVMPDDAGALAALDTPAFMAKFMRHLARTHVAGFHYVEHVPDVRLFYDRSAGGPILMSIMLSGASDDSFPPARAIPVSLSGLARDFEVSRAHVRRLMQEAADAGLLHRVDASDEFKVSPRLSDAIRRVTATYLLHYTHCARLAHADIAAESAVA